MGFFPLEKDIIIPHYFEPFLKKNISLDYAYINKTEESYTLFKADGDQDRPNLPPL
jgi:hypothetical protein